VTSRITIAIVLIAVLAAMVFAVQTVQARSRVFVLRVATGAKDGDYYAFAQALKTLVERHNKNVKLEVLESEGSLQNFDWLESDTAQLALVQSGTPTKPSGRTLAYLFPEVAHLIVRNNAGIRGLADLRGKRVALMPKGSGSYLLFEAIRGHFGLEPGNFTALNLPSKKAYAALLAGEVDAVFRVISRGNPATAKLLASGKVSLVPIDQVESLRLSVPYLEPSLLPKGTYDGARPIPASDLEVAGVRAVLLARSDVPDEAAQAVTQTLFDYRSELVELYPRAAQIQLPGNQDTIGLPFHPGASAYYDQKKPGFFERYTDQIGLFFSLAFAAGSGLLQFRNWLLNRRKNRADEYNLELLNVLELLEGKPSSDDLETARARLLEVLKRVVGALDTDQITPEGFQSFSFTWEAAMAQVRYRETLLR
jgi:uncharacterized protein